MRMNKWLLEKTLGRTGNPHKAGFPGCSLFSRSFRCLSVMLPLCLALFILFAPPVFATDISPGDGSPGLADSARDAEGRDIFPFNMLRNLFGDEVEGMTTTIELMLLLTVLTLVPSILIMMTSFTRIVIVLSFTRNALGTQQMPPNQVMIGLALFLTYFTMFPTITQVIDTAWTPYQEEEVTFDEAFANSIDPLRGFMLGQIRLQNHENDLHGFMNLAKLERPETDTDIPTHVLIPAFITSELKTAFRIGFYIFLPFMVIDMVVASALMSMGMMMLPPAMISLPFKIMLFVVVDGWRLVVQSVIQTFG
ncbi:MAG: flagellar type III secretion system pore protein FliP [Oscillospiraceae bacterium]|nr:flagellar type III secretion system pore protein FliP [Oscillospiraceae bacterium]